MRRLDFRDQPFIIARKYEKPAQIRGIWTNPAWRRDNSRSLWEVESSSPEADAHLKTTLERDWIVVTPPRSGIFYDYEIVERDEDGRPEIRELFIVDARLILRIIPWTSEGEDMKTLGSRILVKPDTPEDKTETGIFMPETSKKRPTTGVITDIGPDADVVVESDGEVSRYLDRGDRILYSLYAGTDIELNGERYVILEANQAQAVVEEGETVGVAR